jgi:hypothetical protein
VNFAHAQAELDGIERSNTAESVTDTAGTQNAVSTLSHD